MRIPLLVLCVVVSACSGGSTGGTGGAGGTGGTGGSGGGGGSGGAGEVPIATCTPAGFTTAPSTVDTLPLPGVASADELQAYAEFNENDAGLTAKVDLTVWDSMNDAGAPMVPAVTVRFNGCNLATMGDVPGVGRKFSASGAAVWVPTAGRFLSFEVVSPQGVLLYRKVLLMPQVLPKIVAVATPAGPTAKVDWTPIPDAGVDSAYVGAYRRLGGGGLQSVGFSMVNAPTGTVMLTLQQAGKLFTLEVQSGTGLSRARLVSNFDVP